MARSFMFGLAVAGLLVAGHAFSADPTDSLLLETEGDGFNRAVPFTFAAEAVAPFANNLHYFVAAPTFVPRESNVTVTYAGAGCVTIAGPSGATDPALTIDVQLPQGAKVKGLRIYHRNTIDSAESRVSFSGYDGLGDYPVNEFVNASGVSGYASTWREFDPAIEIDNENLGYALVYYQLPGTWSGVEFCGASLFYDEP